MAGTGMKLVAPNYRYTVTMDGDGCIRLHAPGDVLIGMLFGHRQPLLGNAGDAFWDAAQWLLMAPADGHGVEPDFWAEHMPQHRAWLESEAHRDDILTDFAEAAAAMGSHDAADYAGVEAKSDAELRAEWDDRRADALYEYGVRYGHAAEGGAE